MPRRADVIGVHGDDKPGGAARDEDGIVGRDGDVSDAGNVVDVSAILIISVCQGLGDKGIKRDTN